MKGDSRCPTGVTCVWGGRVNGVIEIKDGDSSYIMELIQSGLNNQYARETYQEDHLVFKVDPYPEAGKEIASEEYRLVLIVTK